MAGEAAIVFGFEKAALAYIANVVDRIALVTVLNRAVLCGQIGFSSDSLGDLVDLSPKSLNYFDWSFSSSEVIIGIL